MPQELTKQIMVRFSEPDHAAVKQLADSEDRDVSYWVRRAVVNELRRLNGLDLEGWRYNDEISLHLIGDDGDMLVAFGDIDKALFLEACRSFWQSTFDAGIDDERDEPFTADDVDHNLVEIIREHSCPSCQCDEFALSWAKDANKTVPVTVLADIEA